MNEKDKQHLDRWHRAEGTAKPPKRTGAPENNLNPMTHGIWANQCLNDEERELFREIIQRLWNDFEFNKSSDFLQVELVAVYSVKLVRAQINGDMDASEKLDRMIRCHLKDMKATKIAREAKPPGDRKPHPPSGPPPCWKNWPSRKRPIRRTADWDGRRPPRRGASQGRRASNRPGIRPRKGKRGNDVG